MRLKIFQKTDLMGTIFGASLLISLTTLFSACSKNPAELQKKFMSQGTQYLAAGKTNEAVIEFQNLLKVNPRSAQGHYLLGKAYLKKGWSTESVGQFQEAVKENPLLLDAHVELAKYGVNSGQWNATKSEITAILKIDPNNANGWAFSGQRAMALGREKEAQTDLDHALSLKPGLVRALVAVGDLKRHQNHPNQAKKIYEEALTRNPNESRAWDGLGYIAQTLGQSVQADSNFKKAIQVDPSDIRSQIVLANFMAQQGHVKQAISSLKAIPVKAVDLRIPIKIAEYETLIGETSKAIQILRPLERQKIPIPDIYFVLAKAYQKSGRTQDSLDMVDRLLLTGGVPPIMKISAARITFFAGKPDETQKILDSLSGVPHLPVTYWITKGQVELGLNHPAQANRTFRDGLKIFPDNLLLLQNLADVQVSRQNYSSAVHILNGALKEDPHNVGSISRMGALLSRTRGIGAEIVYYREATLNNPDNPAVEVLYLLSMATNKKVPEALTEAKHYLGSHPDNQNVRFLLAQFFLQTGHQKQAIQTDQEILAKDPKNLQALVSLGRQELGNKQYAQAESLYRRALSLSPDNANLNATLGGVLLAENQQIPALHSFQKALSLNPTQPFALLSIAKIELLSGDSRQAITHLSPLMKLPYSPQQQAEIHWLWGLASENIGNIKSARDSFERAVKLAPKNAAYHESLADFWGSLSQWNLAIPEFNKSLKLHPDNPLLVIKKNWAQIQAKSGKPDLAFVQKVVSLALDFQKSHQDSSSASLIAAQGDLILGKPDLALALFNNVLSRDSGNQTALIGKSGVLLTQGHTRQSRTLVKQLLSTHPNNVQGNLIIAAIDQKENKIQEEVDHLQKVHQLIPDWVQPAIELASANLYLHHYEEAQSLSFALHESHPDLAIALYIHGSAEMGLKKYGHALKDFQAVVNNTKNQGPIYLLMSIASQKTGDTQREKKYLELGLKNSPNDPNILNNMAYYLANTENKLPKALDYAQRALKLNPQPGVQDTVGYILFRMGQYSQAEDHFKTAYGAHFRDPEFLYHMGMNEWKMGKRNVASDHLRKSIVSGSLTPEEQEKAQKTLRDISRGA
ncbi:MAG: tetratricopeptide repeat protein [Leptospirales bacterium]